MSQQIKILKILEDQGCIIPLTKNKFAIVDKEDFEKLNKFKWFQGARRYANRMEGTSRKDRKMLYMHREILGYTGKDVIDHINGNPLDNRKTNLRILSNADNLRHKTKLSKHNMSGFNGVHYLKSGKRKKRWMAQIGVNGKSMFIGYYFTPQEAYKARIIFAKENKIII